MNSLFSFFDLWLFGRKKLLISISVVFMIVNTCFSIPMDTIPAQEVLENDTELKKTRKKLESLVFVNPDSTLKLVSQIEKSTDDKSFIALCTQIKGVVATNKGDYKKGIEYNFKALNQYKDLKDDYYVSVSNLNIGVCYMNMTYFSLATKYLYKARDYFDSSDNIFLKGRLYLNLTHLFITLKEYPKGWEYALLAKTYTQEANDTMGLTYAYYNIGSIRLIENKYEEAFTNYKKSLQLSELSGIGMTRLYTLMSIGEVFIATNELDSAKFYLNKVLSNKQSNYLIMIDCLMDYTEISYKQNNYKKGINYINEALVLSKQYGIKDKIAECYKKLAEIYFAMNNFRTGYLYRDSSSILNDSIFEETRIKQASEFEEIYQNKKKKEQIESLSYENKIQKIEFQKTQNFVIGLIVSLGLFLFSGVFVFRYIRLKSKHENSELEQKLLRSQMNPHFIFNAISSIQNYIIKNKPNEAGLYLSNFAKLMRHILLNSRQEFISLEDEIDTIENYLKLQQLRLNHKFEYKINISDEIDDEELAIPPMILQPFVENAIKHGISKKTDSDGIISLKFSVVNNKLVLELEDNGIGRAEADKLKVAEHKSLATEITKDRLKLLGKSFKKNVEIKILDLVDENKIAKGTKVVIKLPVKYV